MNNSLDIYFLPALIGMCSSLIASFVFSWMLFRFKPEIAISDVIAQQKNEGGESVYWFKIINKCTRPAVSIKAELQKVKEVREIEGVVQYFEDIELIRSEVMSLNALMSKDKEGKFAFYFRTLEDLNESLCTDNCFIRLRILAQDSRSGTAKVFEQEYNVTQQVITGRFKTGDCFDIDEVSVNKNL